MLAFISHPQRSNKRFPADAPAARTALEQHAMLSVCSRAPLPYLRPFRFA
jgi:hypothetical protein